MAYISILIHFTISFLGISLLDPVPYKMSDDKGSNKFFSDHSPRRCHSSVAHFLLKSRSQTVMPQERAMTQHMSHATCRHSEALVQTKEKEFSIRLTSTTFRCIHFCGKKANKFRLLPSSSWFLSFLTLQPWNYLRHIFSEILVEFQPTTMCHIL
jgi:hypothetical protein